MLQRIKKMLKSLMRKKKVQRKNLEKKEKNAKIDQSFRSKLNVVLKERHKKKVKEDQEKGLESRATRKKQYKKIKRQ